MVILALLVICEGILFCLNWAEFIERRGKDE